MKTEEREVERAVVHDLSSLLNDYAALHRQAVEQGARTQRELTETRQTLAHVSHDLRTPLTTITLVAELLLDGELPPEQRSMLERIDGAAHAMRDLVQELLDVVATGAAALDREPVDLLAIVDAAAARHRMLHRNLRIETAHDEDLALGPLRVMGDDLKLERVLDNLLGNAVKFSPDGGVVRVRVTDRAPHPDRGQAAQVEVSVTDEGPGIPSDEQATIFAPFKRGHAARNVDGVGLGLAIVAKLVELHGGSVSVTSEPPRGATFTLCLPAVPLTAAHPAQT